MFKKIFLFCMIMIFGLCFCKQSMADSTASADSENTNSMTFVGPIHNHIPGEQHIIHDTRGAAPMMLGVPHGEMPAYFGPFNKNGNWNCQGDSLLIFLLMNNRYYKISDGYWSPSYADSIVDIVNAKEFKARDTMMVLNGIKELQGMKYEFIAGITCHGDKDVTTIDCFKQALYETGQVGGNAFVILKASFDSGVYSSTVGLGGSSAGNLGQGGKEAYVIGSAMGFAYNKGGPVSKPFMHGVALMIPTEDLKKFKNSLKITTTQKVTVNQNTNPEKYQGTK